MVTRLSATEVTGALACVPGWRIEEGKPYRTGGVPGFGQSWASTPGNNGTALPARPFDLKLSILDEDESGAEVYKDNAHAAVEPFDRCGASTQTSGKSRRRPGDKEIP